MRVNDSLPSPAVSAFHPVPQSVRYKRLRVSIVSDAIVGRNGVGTYYEDLMEHLRDRVDHISLIAPTLERRSRLERFSVPMPGDTTQGMIWPRIGALYRMLDQQSPNLMIIPSLGACSYFGLRYAKANNIPIVVADHTKFDRLASLYWPDIISGPLASVLRKLHRWLIHQASMIASLNSDAYEDAKALGARSIRIMGTPVAAEFLRKPSTPRREQISRVIFVGRLAIEKGLDQILAAAKTHSQIEFAIAGDGPGRALVENAASTVTNIQYLGWLSRERVLQELDRSEALLLPSAFESFGTVALEALARKRYVLVRPDCGIAKWPSLAGGLFYINEDESVAETLERLMAIPIEARDGIARRSWDAVHDFNQHTISRWLGFLADAMDSHSDAHSTSQAA
ncbi:MAG: glycosyltransferase [Planctomycetota bacterium]